MTLVAAMSFSLSPSLSIKKVGDELFVLDRSMAQICSFNRTGAFIFERLQREQDHESIIADLAATFEVDTSTAQKDLSEFTEMLRAGRLIVENGEHDRDRSG
ncbi:MAG: PqqD family peptide modification chaperone [Chitinivibrionales bacterium]|nr:PqqD family peptide modification chaperone [Chitinivibrionales bacterium]